MVLSRLVVPEVCERKQRGCEMRVMLSLTTVVASVLFLGFAPVGCSSDGKDGKLASLESEVKRLNDLLKLSEDRNRGLYDERRSLTIDKEQTKTEYERLAKQVTALEAGNKSMQESLDALASATDKIKDKQIEDLKAQIERLAQQAKAPGASPATSDPPDASVRDASIEKVKATIADLEAQIGELQPKVAMARSKVTNLCRGTIDRRITGGGNLICGRLSGSNLYPHGRSYYYHTHDASCYAPVWERTEQGTFRTQHDKDEAIRSANEEKLPLEQMLLNLRNDLEKARQELRRLPRGG